MQKLFFLFIICFFSTVLVAQEAPKREFRGVWVASVLNIDWPSNNQRNVFQQKKEVIRYFDEYKKSGFNAIIVQVRSTADACYNSRLAPWSSDLTGIQGKSPSPYYDPLTFMVAEAHKRGLEFHAWLNPYRASVSLDTALFADEHAYKVDSSQIISYGNRMYFDPGKPEVQEQLLSVVREIVRYYDIDALHFDDYFYPYKIAGQEFPDSLTYQKYGAEQFDHIDDWRRDNVNRLIEGIAKEIKILKPHVRFGISPFGVWRNKQDDPEGSDTKAGQTNYDHLYADILKWLQEGWIDYVAPQLYWPFTHKAAPYEPLVTWWNSHSYGKQVYIGHGMYRVDGESKTNAWKNPSEILNQIKRNRELENIHGSIFFSAKSLLKNPLGVRDSLEQKYFKHPSLIGEMPWLPAERPLPVHDVTITGGRKEGVQLTWDDPDESSATAYLIYRFKGNEKGALQTANHLVARVERTITDQQVFQDNQIQKNGRYVYLITSINRANQESHFSYIYRVKVGRRKVRGFDKQSIDQQEQPNI